MAAMEHALEFLADYAALGGEFLSRRFGLEAWPQMEALLRRGPDQPLGTPVQDAHAPAVVQRARLAVMTSLLGCCITRCILRTRVKLCADLRSQATLSECTSR